MSYILDALKKAESERQLGNVPGVHAQAAPASTGKPLVSWLIVGLLALIAILLVWRTLAPVVPSPSPSAAPAVAPPAAVSTASAAQPTIATNPGIATQAPAVVASTPALAVPAVQAAPAAESGRKIVQKEVPAKALAKELAVAPVVAAPTVVSKAFIPDGAAVGKAATSIGTGPATGTAPTTTTTPAPAKLPAPAEVDADEFLPLLAQLPEVIQREVPAIAVKGYMYSKNPADRVLIIGSNFHHEGDDFPNGVRLEKLLPKAAVFSYKGFRYRVAY